MEFLRFFEDKIIREKFYISRRRTRIPAIILLTIRIERKNFVP